MTNSKQDSPYLPPEEASYFREIEQRFCALRGAPMLLSPRDWSLIDGWWKAGIPLPLVLDALDDVFATRRHRGEASERVSSLAYLRSEIERRWRLRRELSTPRRGERAEEERLRKEIRRHLGRVARALGEAAEAARRCDKESLAQTLLMVASEVRHIRKEVAKELWEPSGAEARLEKLDIEVLEAVGSVLKGEERRRLGEELDTLLRPHEATMTEAAREETRRAWESRLLRSSFGIPRISLLGEG